MGVGPFELLLVVAVVVVLWAVVRVCRRVGWPGWLALLALIPGVNMAFVLVLAWEALPRAGRSRWFSPFAIVPLANALMFLLLAFSRWPTVETLRPLNLAGVFGPLQATPVGNTRSKES
jgi:hypothetical protein